MVNNDNSKVYEITSGDQAEKKMKIQPWQLQQRKGLPLEMKMKLTEQRIRAWYEHFDGEVYISFSGGKDSTVLLDMVRNLYPKVTACFVDTGLEYPEVRNFVKTIDNVAWLRPKMPFTKVIEKYGYPVISKENAQKIEEIRNTKSDKLRNKRLHGDAKGNGKLPEKWKFMIDAPFKISGKCCNVMKKAPVKAYERLSGKKAIVGIMAGDSWLRQSSYLNKGCNSFDSKRPTSQPMAFWNESDIWDYINKYHVPYSKIYDMGYERTGCMFCMFGMHMDKGENPMQRMERTHPKRHDYCINNLGCGKVLDFMGINYKADIPTEYEIIDGGKNG